MIWAWSARKWILAKSEVLPLNANLVTSNELQPASFIVGQTSQRLRTALRNVHLCDDLSLHKLYEIALRKAKGQTL